MNRFYDKFIVLTCLALQAFVACAFDAAEYGFDPGKSGTENRAAFVKAVHEAGYSFHVWTVDSPDPMRQAFAAGVDTLTTNCAQALLDS